MGRDPHFFLGTNGEVGAASGSPMYENFGAASSFSSSSLAAAVIPAPFHSGLKAPCLPDWQPRLSGPLP